LNSLHKHPVLNLSPFKQNRELAHSRAPIVAVGGRVAGRAFDLIADTDAAAIAATTSPTSIASAGSHDGDTRIMAPRASASPSPRAVGSMPSFKDTATSDDLASDKNLNNFGRVTLLFETL
jgi:hypothetical protein